MFVLTEENFKNRFSFNIMGSTKNYLMIQAFRAVRKNLRKE